MDFLTVAILSLMPLLALSDLVHVVEQTEVGGVTTVVSDETKITGMPWATATAPTVSGQIFTHWTISTKQEFVSRDEWGRAYDAPSFKLYEDTTLTAHYLPTTQDDDGDGIADGYEIYWYGNLGQGAASDTDGDGWTFAEELANGTNPLTPETDVDGPITYGDGDLLLYNPSNYASVVIRSDPEGLFTASEEWLRPGTYVATGSYSPTSSKFSYWTRNGVAVRDEWGRAVDQVELMMGTNNVELVAVLVDDANDRQKLYWYGATEVALESDTDGDGFTFAEEIANGTNPLTPENDIDGPITYADGDLLQYNPKNLQPYTIKSDPEGALFETINDYAPFGTFVDATTYSPNSSTFACWMLNGVEQRDAWGRAVESISLQMSTNAQVLIAKVIDDDESRQKYYWYGSTDVSMESDTDGDGMTFAEELANGTNPLTPESEVDGPVTYADTELHEANLQPFEQAQGALLDGEYQQLFYSPIAGNTNCLNFGAGAVPNVLDVNGDGLFDLVVVSQTGYAVLLNIGSEGNPQFEYRTDISTNGLDLVDGGLERLVGLDLDVTPTDAVSCTFGDVDQDGVEDLLVADTDGRIWYYHNSGGAYYLQNKVWAGSREDFANGLHLAAVDWDGDGDLDCVCGTTEGRLMLLVDPRIGRPMNVRAEAGANSVVLTWDASVNSRVRGYGVYRSVDSNNYDQVQALWPLPTYRDIPSVLQDYYYRVTSMSRHYISGNSAPIISESMPTEAVYVQFRPSVWLNDTSSFTDTNVEMIVSMNNSMGLNSDGFTMTFAYDPEVLEPVCMRATGLTEDLNFDEVKVKGEGEQWNWKLSATGGEIGTGAGRFLRLVFYVKPVTGVDETIVSITAATVKAKDGHAVTLELPKSAKIEISERKKPESAVVAVHVDDVVTETETEFEMDVTVTSTETLTNFTADIAYDAQMLEWRGVTGGTIAGNVVGGDVLGAPRVISSGGDFTLTFYAKDPESVLTNLSTVVSLTNIVAVDCHGLTTNAPNASGTVLLKNVHPWTPATVSVSTEDKKVNTLEEVVVPFKVTSSAALKSGSFTVDWDETALEYVGVSGGVVGSAVPCAPLTIEATGDFSLTFLAKDQHTVSKTQVLLTAATVTDVHEFVISPTVPVTSTVLIHDAHPLVPARVSLTLGDVKTKTEQTFEMTLGVTTTEALTNLVMTHLFDEDLLEIRKVTGAELRAAGTSAPTIVAAGTVSETITLTFYAKENHEIQSSDVTITPISGRDHNGLAAEFAGNAVGKVVFEDSNPWQPATVSVAVDSKKVDTLTEFEVPVTITSNQKLTNFVATVSWDEDVLEWRGVEGATASGGRGATALPTVVTGSGSNFTLKFYAKNQHAVTATTIELTNMSAADEHGLTANPIADATGVVLIHDSQPLVPAEVAIKAGDVSVETRQNFTVPIAVTSTKALTNLSMNVSWDASVLEWKGVAGATACGALGDCALPTGVTNLVVNGEVPETILVTFYAKDQHAVKKTAVALSEGAAVCSEGLAANVTVAGGTVNITDSNPPVAATFVLSALDVKAESGQSFVVNVGTESVGDLGEVVFTLEWDASHMTFNGCEESATTESISSNSRRFTFAASGTDNRFHLNFTAAAITGLQASSWAKVTAASATGANGLAAQLKTKLPDTSNILIVRQIGKYDPGDINGDGKYTDIDLDLLNKYIAYLNVLKTGNKYAIAAMQKYKLTGRALKAADVNQDGFASDSNDVAMLANFIAAAKEAAK